MIKHKRVWWRALITLASAGLVSGCYYYPYGYYPWGYPYPYAWGYPYPYMPAAPPSGAPGSVKSAGGNAATAEWARRADTAAAGAIAALHAR